MVLILALVLAWTSDSWSQSVVSMILTVIWILGTYTWLREDRLREAWKVERMLTSNVPTTAHCPECESICVAPATGLTWRCMHCGASFFC